MKNIRIGKFLCIGENVSHVNKNGWRVYYAHNEEERFVGYSQAILHEGYDYDESVILGNGIGDYSAVLRSWESSTTRLVYKINVYEAYRMDDRGIRYMFRVPEDTIDYKHEVLGIKEVRFPSWSDGELITENDNDFSFVSKEGIQTYTF